MTNNNMYFIANWKMYGSLNSVDSIKKVITLSMTKSFKNVKIVYCPPYTLIRKFVENTKNSKILIGAQNCHSKEDYGAFTGSINSKMIKNIGCKFVIIGHSENRINGETDKDVNLKIKSALKEKLKVIFCIGETLLEKKKNKTKKVLKKQITNGLYKIKNINNILVSYEPVWSIGTGVIPKVEDLKNQINFIKSLLKEKFGSKNFNVLYGGSVNSKNINSLIQIKEIKGFLIGGSSQKAKIFIDIIKKTIN